MSKWIKEVPQTENGVVKGQVKGKIWRTMIPYVLKDGFEHLLLTEHIENKRDRGKQQVTWQVCANEWWNKYHKEKTVHERENTVERNRRQEDVENHDYTLPEGTWHQERVIYF